MCDTRDVLLTKPSLLQTKGWTTTTLNKIIAVHKREGMLLNQAIILETNSNNQTLSSSSAAAAAAASTTTTTVMNRPRPTLQLPWDENEDETGGYQSNNFFSSLPAVRSEPNSPRYVYVCSNDD